MAQRTLVTRKGQDADVKALTVSSTAAITGNTTVGGTLAVTGNTTIGGNVTVTGSLVPGRFAVQTLTSSGAITTTSGLILLNHATVAVAATLAAPTAGDHLIITDSSASGTAGHTVTLPAGVTWDGTNNTATLNAPGETLDVVAISATRWLILENIGSVGLSTV